jgi:hypothetical protein
VVWVSRIPTVFGVTAHYLIFMTDKQWEEAKQRGLRKNAFALALDESFEHLGPIEQEEIFANVSQKQRKQAENLSSVGARPIVRTNGV